ncbi:hypothetical protein N9N28_07345 [Rubripirellula amarantea]|uniref:Uncharacterized protein n=1 Tax=Rubripirellula amarantea TaxID=2527999 RepID=A0A5C5WR25_9BACT|nr:hypothetical protein [Rubripirellula amarantea]MDA8744429.1 hypothetical protein [Rubripirellula amarantea]TWT53344.1 hypothetical protein Pla22_09730 [Rubripirellula amarantea]
MRFSFSIVAIVVACLLGQSARAQTTISDRPLELTFGKASWATLMPGYELGSETGGGLAFQDDLDSPGALWELRAIRRFLHTRTSFEARTFYGTSWSNQSNSTTGISVPNPVDGSAIARGAGNAHLGSDLDHYGIDLVIRDTWRTQFGGLSAGMAFSYMAFDQEFELNFNETRLMTETLDSDFLGGKVILGWDGYLLGKASTLDLWIGYFDVDADYNYTGGTAPGSLNKQLADQSATIETRWTTWHHWGDRLIGTTLGGMYITDMPTIVHNSGSQATLSTDDAATVSLMFEILL